MRRQGLKPSTLITRTGVGGAGASALMIAIALGIVYVVWGSTYLAIRVMVEDLPALASAGWRYLCGGLILGALLALRGGVRRLRATRSQLLGCAALGLLLPMLGNGLVSLGESWGAPSGLAALIVAAVPLWVIVFRGVTHDWPSRRTTAGVLLGFAGLAGLVTASGLGGRVDLSATLIIVLATMCWSFGSWSTPRLDLPSDPFVTTVYEMVFGAGFLLIGALLHGENVLPQSAPRDAWIAWAYLVVFGSVVAFTAYVWVLNAAPISLVATYAYVNPVVAVFLGWLILSEPVTTPIVIGGGVVVVAVALVVASERKAPRVSPARTHGDQDPEADHAPEPTPA